MSLLLALSLGIVLAPTSSGSVVPASRAFCGWGGSSGDRSVGVYAHRMTCRDAWILVTSAMDRLPVRGSGRVAGFLCKAKPYKGELFESTGTCKRIKNPPGVLPGQKATWVVTHPGGGSTP